MSLLLTHRPYEMSLARNKVAFEIKTTNLYEQYDILPFITLQWDEESFQGDGFQFQVTDPESGALVDILFQASPTPDTDDNFYIDDSFVGSLADYVLEVSDKLELNGKLASYFNISYDGFTTITLTAKEATIDLVPVNYSELQVLTPTPHDHINHTISTTFFKKKRRSNYLIFLDVFIEENFLLGDWKKVATLKDEPSAGGKAVFDIATILDAEIKESFEDVPLPTIGLNTVHLGNGVRRYYVAYEEVYDDQPLAPVWITDDPLFVHCGGVSDEDFALQNPFIFISAKQKFLTWQANPKKIKNTQNDWLVWSNYTNVTAGFKVKMKVYFKDGTSTGFIDLFNQTLEAWKEIIIPSGYVQRDIQALVTTSDVYKWELSIFIQPADTQVSETFTYLLNDVVNKHDREMLYLNAFCQPETFLTTGEWVEGITVKKLFGSRNLAHNYNLVNGQKFQFDQEARNNFKARSGYLTKEQALSLRDLLITADVFLLDNMSYLPVLIDPKSFQLVESLTFLNQVELIINKSFRVNNHSDANQLPVFIEFVNCGLQGFALDPKGYNITNYGDMKVSLDGVVVYAALAHTFFYLFPAVEKKGGLYQMEVDITIEGIGVVPYRFNYLLTLAKMLFEPWNYSTNLFYARTFPGETESVFVDWGVSADEIEYPITDVATLVSFNSPVLGVKKAVATTNCPEKIEGIGFINSQIQFVNMSDFTEMKTIVIAFDILKYKTIDFSPFQKVEIIQLNTTDASAIVLGFHPNLTSFEFNGNALSSIGIEKILLKIWEYREYYSVVGPIVLLQANPGAGVNMTQTSLDIINGTNAYVGEGLIPNYGFAITY